MCEDNEDAAEVEEFEFDPSAIRARMMYPRDEKAGREIWAALQVDAMVKRAARENLWPLPLQKDEFLFLSEAPPLRLIAERIESRLHLGWVIAMAFHHYFNSLSSRGFDVEKHEKEAGTQNRLLEAWLVKNDESKKIPGTDAFRVMNRSILDTAKKEVWPAAHYWAVYFFHDGEQAFPDNPTPEEWTTFMRVAETYRLLGQELGVFKKLAPAKADSSAVLHDPRFEPVPALKLKRMDTEASELLRNYISEETNRLRRKRADAAASTK